MSAEIAWGAIPLKRTAGSFSARLYGVRAVTYQTAFVLRYVNSQRQQVWVALTPRPTPRSPRV